jgi:phage minor structural protein
VETEVALMREGVPQIYDRRMERLAFLQNASEVGYTMSLNALYTASFALPADDGKNIYCQVGNFVEIYDGEKRIELFRIVGEDISRSTEAYTVYQCEHVLATLLNDVLFRYHQIGGLGVYTQSVIRYVLDRQTTQFWQLARCDFSRQFEYKWENTNLLAALFSIANIFSDAYMWTYDTTALPWRISLTAMNPDVRGEIRYQKNLVRIRRVKDSGNIVTRILPLGYGEGDNQLTIAEVNGGIPYLDADTVSDYGLIQSVLVDRRFESAASLKEYAQTVLNELKHPYVSYEIKAIDLARFSPGTYDDFRLGDVVRVIDEADGITVDAPIVEIGKSDTRGAPQDMDIVLANKSRDVAGSIADLQNRALIGETYAQGATNLQTINFADNADSDNPAELRVYIPAEMARINKMILSVRFEAFRGYTKAVESAPGRTQTSNLSGNSVLTSSAGGGSVQATTNAQINLTSTNAGGGGTETTDTTTSEPDGTPGGGLHNHGLPGGTRLAVTSDGKEVTGAVVWVPSGKHKHSLIVPYHTHGLTVPQHGHTVNIPSHNHQTDIPAHSHSVEIPTHNHNIAFGIYRGQAASAANIFTDGVLIPSAVVSDLNNIDVTPYLSKDDGGKILRGVWHTIQIKPNGLTRVVAALFTQLFVNSRGGGDY